MEENTVRTVTSFNFARDDNPNPTNVTSLLPLGLTIVLLYSQRVPKLSKVAGRTGAASGGGTQRRRVTVGTDRHYQQRGHSGHQPWSQAPGSSKLDGRVARVP